jgi:hypothetical protein
MHLWPQWIPALAAHGVPVWKLGKAFANMPNQYLYHLWRAVQGESRHELALRLLATRYRCKELIWMLREDASELGEAEKRVALEKLDAFEKTRTRAKYIELYCC